MRTPLEIRNDALDCLRQADRVQARRHKAVLLILAQGWASLAEEMERRGLVPGEDPQAVAADDGDGGEELAEASSPSAERRAAGAN